MNHCDEQIPSLLYVTAIEFIEKCFCVRKKDVSVKKLELIESYKIFIDDGEDEIKKDDSRNWLSTFCMYKLSELVYFYVPTYYNNSTETKTIIVNNLSIL